MFRLLESVRESRTSRCIEWRPGIAFSQFGRHGGAAIGELIVRMAKILRVHLTAPPNPALVCRFRNFGEEVYTALMEECAVSIEEIDAATTTFPIREIHRRFVRTAATMVREMLLKHQMSEIVTVDEIPEITNA